MSNSPMAAARGLIMVFGLLTVPLSQAATPAGAAELKVVVTSKPAHALTAAIMEGVGTPRLLVEGSTSPHTFTLKPSGAKAVSEADVFIRISESIEPFTAKLVKVLPRTVGIVTLAETKGLEVLKRRRGATFDAHDGHDGHADHDDDDAGDAVDGHVWLDPANTGKLAAAIASALSEKAPQHRERFEANAKALENSVSAVTAEIMTRMKPLAGRPFVVFHDATQYFERRFGLSATGSITVSPDVHPSAKRLNAIRAKIKASKAVCVFSEPAYQERLVAAVTEGTSARPGVIDPEGLKLEPGPGLYVALMRSLADGFESCLGKPS